jgi:hypothetical protein
MVATAPQFQTTTKLIQLAPGTPAFPWAAANQNLGRDRKTARCAVEMQMHLRPGLRDEPDTHPVTLREPLNLTE